MKKKEFSKAKPVIKQETSTKKSVLQKKHIQAGKLTSEKMRSLAKKPVVAKANAFAARSMASKAGAPVKALKSPQVPQVKNKQDSTEVVVAQRTASRGMGRTARERSKLSVHTVVSNEKKAKVVRSAKQKVAAQSPILEQSPSVFEVSVLESVVQKADNSVQGTVYKQEQVFSSESQIQIPINNQRVLQRRIVAVMEEEIPLSDFERRILTAEGYKKSFRTQGNVSKGQKK